MNPIILDNIYKYLMIKKNNHNNYLRHLKLHKVQSIRNHRYIPRGLSGIIAFYSRTINKIEVSFSNDVSRRLDELKKKHDISNFTYSTVPDDHYQRVDFRHALKMHLIFMDNEKKGIVPQVT